MALNRTFTLNNGVEIPAVGFGTWQAKPDEVRIAVEIALRTGYRHLDCAAIYRNEVEVGEGIRASGVDRKDIFVSLLFVTTSKCYLSLFQQDMGIDHFEIMEQQAPARRC